MGTVFGLVTLSSWASSLRHSEWRGMESVHSYLCLCSYIEPFKVFSGAWLIICVIPYITRVLSTHFIFGGCLGHILLLSLIDSELQHNELQSTHYSFHLYQVWKLTYPGLSTPALSAGEWGPRQRVAHMNRHGAPSGAWSEWTLFSRG